MAEPTTGRYIVAWAVAFGTSLFGGAMAALAMYTLWGAAGVTGRGGDLPLKEFGLGLLAYIVSLAAFKFSIHRLVVDHTSRSGMKARFRLDDVPDRVLYLREFDSDPSPWPSLMPWRFETLETELQKAFEPIGRLIAVGRPGRLQTPGPIQIYADDHEWQRTVIEELRTAQLVVLRVGDGPGLLWELSTALDIVPPDRLLLLRIGVGEQEWRQVSEALEATVGSQFTSMLPSGDGSRDGFVLFDESRKASFLPLQEVPFWRRSLVRPLGSRLAYTLRPVLERFGCEWREPPISSSRIALVAWLGLLTLGLFALLVVEALAR